MTALAALIAKLEAATEGSRELDAEIRFHVADDMNRCNFDEGSYHGDCDEPGCGGWLGLHDERRSYPQRWQDDERLPRYTTSLDAALTLVPVDPKGGWYWRVGHSSLYRGWAHLNRYHPDNCDTGDETSGNAATPALALCIAALRARMGK